MKAYKRNETKRNETNHEQRDEKEEKMKLKSEKSQQTLALTHAFESEHSAAYKLSYG